ncbi:ABC transporter ATP-binding protein [Actinoplanes sp. NPDC026619]|uniref:ABC transporter ATP-binding protein n=1 Tax=Actinoplanes sp. NPDC026619 TaxID=3155798 RepID=UPI0033F8156B
MPTPTRSAVRSLARLWPWVRPVRLRLAAATVLAAAASVLALLMPLVLKGIADGPVAHRDPAGVWLGGGLLLALGVAEAAIFGVRRRLVARPLAAIEAGMRQEFFGHVQRLPVAAHERWPSGQLLSRCTTDLQLLHGFLAVALPFLVVNAVTLVVGSALLLAQQWLLGLLLLAPVPVLLPLCALLETRYAAAARQAQDQVGDVTTTVQESILGIRVITGLGRRSDQARRFRQLAGRLRDTELGKARLLATVSVLLSVLPDLALAAVLMVGVTKVADGTVSAGTLLAVVAIAGVLKPSVDSTAGLLALSNAAAGAADRYLEVMGTPAVDEVPAGPVARRGRGPAGLVFDRVRFRYPGSPRILDEFSLRIEPGESVALVGATGSGKSTVAALVPRLYEPAAGRIRLDGTDIATMSRDELRGLVAVAFQEPTLFSAGIADNVLMGSRSTGAAELDRALRIAQADEFVRALPEGAGTRLGEQGMTLSGGQRQRLALARAVAARPRLMVLDDPLSALDIDTEALIEAALRRVLATTTALIVAHRPSTALLADRVALLSGGRIAATGTHHELLRTNREYAELMTPVTAR